MTIQSQYPNLHYISYWELAVCNFALWNIPQSLVYWRKLRAGATWSRACYAYGVAACLLQISSGTGDEGGEAREMLREIPKLMNKIAGKSIPIEVRACYQASDSSSYPHAPHSSEIRGTEST